MGPPPPPSFQATGSKTSCRRASDEPSRERDVRSSRTIIIVVVSGRTDPDDDVVDVTSFSAPDVILVHIPVKKHKELIVVQTLSIRAYAATASAFYGVFCDTVNILDP